MLKKVLFACLTVIICCTSPLVVLANYSQTNNSYSLESSHFIWNCDINYLEGNISPTNFEMWMLDLDKVYVLMRDLVGRAPFDNKKIEISADSMEYWAVATSDHRIVLEESIIIDEMKRIERTGFINFGFIHEIGHLFDNDGGYEAWVFNAEESANTKALYVLDTLNIKVWYLDKLVENHQLIDEWNADCALLYDKNYGQLSDTIVFDIATNNIRKFHHETAWKPLKQTYRSFLSLMQEPFKPTISDYITTKNNVMWSFINLLNSFSLSPVESYFYKDVNNEFVKRFSNERTPRTIIGNEEYKNASFIDLEIPNSVTEIEVDAFWGNRQMTRLSIPESVTLIEDYAFNNCDSLKEIYIYARSIEIGDRAFWNDDDAKYSALKKNVVIYGYKDSDVESFSKKNGFSFAVLPKIP